jgi:hypothetical protein
MPFEYPIQSALNGNNATDVMLPGTDLGGGVKTCNCPAGDQSVGGGGGDEGPGGQDGTDGSPAHGAGQGGTSTSSCVDGVGKNGNPPPANNNDGIGASMLGTLTSGGWEPKAGGAAMTGVPGQGGGGGASGNTGVGAGGGGGCGGCGGAAGPAGGGGGASIALLVLDSSVTVDQGALVATAAGLGGSGAAGQQGQMIFGFGGVQTTGGCSGGNGAIGASGGAAGGGAGGVSAGVVHKGGAPTLTESPVMKGPAGNKGIGGTPGMNDGIDGTSQDVLPLD